MLRSQYRHLAGSKSKQHDKLRDFCKASKVGANLTSGEMDGKRMGAMYCMTTRPHQVITPLYRRPPQMCLFCQTTWDGQMQPVGGVPSNILAPLVMNNSLNWTWKKFWQPMQLLEQSFNLHSLGRSYNCLWCHLLYLFICLFVYYICMVSYVGTTLDESEESIFPFSVEAAKVICLGINWRFVLFLFQSL